MQIIFSKGRPVRQTKSGHQFHRGHKSFAHETQQAADSVGYLIGSLVAAKVLKRLLDFPGKGHHPFALHDGRDLLLGQGVSLRL